MNRVELARQLDYIREAGPNAGQRVEAIQHWCGGQKGESWCCYWATLVLDVEFKGKAPFPRGGVCQDLHLLAIQKNLIIPQPEVGCLVLSVTPEGHAHHIGICTGVLFGLTVIAGNTSEDGKSSNGTGVFEHEVSPELKVYVRVPNG